MNYFVRYFVFLARKWAWIVVLGIIICAGTTFIASKKMHPVYQASATLIISLGTSTSALDNLNASVEAIPTYAQLVTSNQVLDPVVAQHRKLTVSQLRAVTVVKQQSNTQLVEVDVEGNDPHIAMQLANEIGQSFALFANTRLPGTVEILPAQLPNSPIRPQTIQNTEIGALVGLGLAMALIVAFEWIDDRVRNPEEVQELLGGKVLSVLPRLTRKQRSRNAMSTLAFAEECRILCARLQTTQKISPFKLLMITSPLGSEGKSMVASHLAGLLAMTGNRVLLVDANQSTVATEDKDVQHEKHPVPADNALQTWMNLQGRLNGSPSNIPNLRTLALDTVMASYAGILPFPWNSRFFEYFHQTTFDYIIFDAPSLLSTATSQVLASSVQAILLVVDTSQTSRKVLGRVKELLNSISNASPFIVINKSEWPEWINHHQYEQSPRTHETSIQHQHEQGSPANQTSKRRLQKLPATPTVPPNGKIDTDATIIIHTPKYNKNNHS